jgi:hypothetical protein
MFKKFVSSLSEARATHQSCRRALRLFAALMIVGLSVQFDGGTNWIMRQAHSNEATNDGYNHSKDDWKEVKQKQRADDDRLLCVLATVLKNGRFEWETGPTYRDKATEAKRRGLQLENCFRLIGHNGQPNTGSISRNQPRTTSASASSEEATHNRRICRSATVYRNGLWEWDDNSNYQKYRDEARRLGLSIGSCASLLGYTGQRDRSVATAQTRSAKSTTPNPIIPVVTSKPKIVITPTDEPMIVARNANVRDRPGTDGAKVAYLQKGDGVTVVGRVRGLNWVEVVRDGIRLGFIFSPLLAERPFTRSQKVTSSPTTPPSPIKRAPTNKHAVAVILGNRDYGNPVPDVDYATNDADAMRRFVIDQLGYRDGNIIDLRDASQAEMNSVFGRENDHHGKLWRLVRPGKSDVTVFYSGHGVPGLRDKKGYLLPVDADPDTVELNGYPLDWLLSNLAKIKSRSMTVYLDACFSGESPKGMLIQAVSGLSIEPRMPATNSSMTVITAATGDQVASWDKKAKHGLFTKHLLDALGGAADKGDYGNGDGKVTVSEVKRYLDDEMTYAAQRNYGRVQTATIKGDADTVLAVVH